MNWREMNLYSREMNWPRDEAGEMLGTHHRGRRSNKIDTNQIMSTLELLPAASGLASKLDELN